MKKIHIFLLLINLLYACSNYPPDIEAVLKQAGSNRGELEKVMKHYSRNPADSLKLRAAKFLIANMTGKYSEYYDAPWNDIAAACLRRTSAADKQRLQEAYILRQPIVKEDVKHISAAYLINNIELAFEVWQKRPWGKHIPFDDFCEDILPYRLETEQLENWREKALATFSDLENDLNRPDMTAEKACEIVNNALPRFRIDKDFPFMNFSQLMATTRGQCDDIAALEVFSMRALGIPVTFEYSPRWIDAPNAHCWNTVRSESGKHIRFMYNQISEPSKVYRLMYALQPSIQTTENNIPHLLKTGRNMKDVTAEYANVADVTLPLLYPADSTNGYVYLAIGNKREWYPIAWTTANGQKAHFNAMRKNMLYIPVYYADEIQIPAGAPFWIDNNGNTLNFSCDTRSNEDTLIVFHEIMPSGNIFKSLLKQGVFEGANKPDFSDAKIIHTITEIPEPSYNEVALPATANYRYLRYKAPKNSRCQMAEIAFYNAKNEILDGNIIGTQGAWKNSDKTIDKVFDNDISTYYEAAEDGSWVGLDRNTIPIPRPIRNFTDNYGHSRFYLFALQCVAHWNSTRLQVRPACVVQMDCIIICLSVFSPIEKAAHSAFNHCVVRFIPINCRHRASIVATKQFAPLFCRYRNYRQSRSFGRIPRYSDDLQRRFIPAVFARKKDAPDIGKRNNLRLFDLWIAIDGFPRGFSKRFDRLGNSVGRRYWETVQKPESYYLNYHCFICAYALFSFVFSPSCFGKRAIINLARFCRNDSRKSFIRAWRRRFRQGIYVVSSRLF
jgi:hypothetical protein